MNSKARNAFILLAVMVGIGAFVAGCGSSSDDSSSDNSTASTSSSSAGTGYGAAASSDSSKSDNSAAAAGSGAAGGGTSQTMTLAANPNGAISYDKTALTTGAGKSKIEFTNMSSVAHAVEVEGNGIEKSTPVVTGGKATLALDLKPGKYEFYCPVGDHKEDGMKGTLVVK